MLLPTGEFAYPAGNDWTFHCSTNQGYFAYIATALNDFDAAQAEAQRLERSGELSKVAEIRYGRLVELQKKLEAANVSLRKVQEGE